MESEDLEDSLDSLFSSVGSPSSQLKSSVADEDKRREARLYHQQKNAQSGTEDVDSLLSELRSARTGGASMARTAANVFDNSTSSPPNNSSRARSGRRSGNTSPTSGASSAEGSPKPRGGRRRNRDDAKSSVARDAANFLETGYTSPQSSSGSASPTSGSRSRRFGGAAVSWLDSSPKTSPKAADITPSIGLKTKSSINNSTDDDTGMARKSSLAQRAAHQALDTSSPEPAATAGNTDKPWPYPSKNKYTDIDDRRPWRSQAGNFAAQEAMKTAEQAREAAKAKQQKELLEKEKEDNNSGK